MKKIIFIATIFIGLTLSSFAQVNLTNALLAHLPMNGNGNDISGNSNNAILSATGVYPTSNVTDIANQAMLFNGAIENGTMDFGSPLLNNRTEFSMSFWFNPSSLTNGMSLVGQDNILETGFYTAPNRIIFFHPTSTSVSVNLTSGANTWQHFAITCSATQLKYYLNGTLVNTLNGNYTLGNNTSNTRIGGNVVNQNNNSWFRGKIDEVRFYTREITQDEVNVLSGSGSLTYSLGTLSNATFCAGASFTIPLTVIATNLQTSNVFNLQLSDANGNFTNATTLATLSGNTSGTFNAILPTNIPSGAGYKLRTVSSLPLFIGAESSQTITINNPSQSFSTLYNGRILWYKFDASVADSSGNALDATLAGVTSYTTDRFNNATGALQLNGTSGHAVAPAATYFEGAFTVSTWIKPTSYNNWSRVFDFGRGAALDNILGAISQQTSGNVAAENYSITTGGQVNSTNKMNLNAWNHIVFRWDGTLLQIYLNGYLVGSGVSNNPRLVYRNLCYIGRSNWAGDAYANAAFDDFMIYNRAVTEDEILTLANDGIIHFNQTPCLGSTLQLSAPLIVGATYQWNGPAGFTSTQRQNFIANTTAANSGNYTLTITLGSCTPFTQTRNITIINPATQPTVTYTGLPANTNIGVIPFSLTGTPTGGTFFGPGIQNINQFNPALAGIGTHVIYYQAQGTGGCLTTFADTINVQTSTNIASDTVINCNGGFYDSGGSGANYNANEDFTQTFCTGTSDQFRFNFSAFNFGTGDTLFVYDGGSINNYLIAYYIQGSGADALWSSGSCITFRFKSNATSQGTGWVAAYQCMPNPAIVNEVTTMTVGMHQVCGTTLYDPSGTSNYGQGFWSQTYRAAQGQRLQFQYTSFAINGNNGGHWLRIYDGPTSAFPLIGQYNNFNFIPAIITSSGEYLTFVFDATNTNAGFGGNSGFVGNLTCFGTALTNYVMNAGVIAACSGVFYDDGGPSLDFTPNQYRKQTFCSDNTQHIQFRFNNNLSLADAGDTLWVYDGADTLSVLLGYYIQGSSIERLTSSGTCLTFRFKSNASTEPGWQAFIKCVPDIPTQDTIRISSGLRATCNAFIADNSGPFAYGYGYNEQTYRSYNGQRLKFVYSLFNINGNNGGHWLRIYDGPNTSYPLIGQYNNFNFIPASVESTGEYLTFVFDRNNTNAGVGSAQGYEGTLSCTTPSLPVYTMGNGVLNVCEGVFYDDAGPAANYNNGQDYTQTFCSANNQLLRIVFNLNETAFASGDTLWAYDGANTSAAPLGMYIAGSRIEPLTSSGTCLTFRYKSNASNNARGWQGVISCITSPPPANTYIISSGIRYVCNGVFLDPGGSGNYPVGGGNTWTQTFTSYSNERLRATVNFININGNNGGHWIRVYDGPSTASPLIGSYNNFNGWPPAFESTGSSLTFRFESTNTNAGAAAGYQFTFSCFTGSPIDVAWLNSPLCRGATVDVPYTVNTSVNANNTYTVQLSNASGSFASPVNIGTLASTALTGTISATIPIGTAPGNGYRIRINSSQPVQLGSPNPNPITVIATPTQPGTINVTGNTTFCSGTGSATLSISNQSGMNYQWIKNDTVFVGTNSNSLVANLPGVYKIIIYNDCDSIVSNSSITITSIDAPIAPSINTSGPTTFCNGGNVELSVTAQTGVTYQWKNGNANVGTNTNTYTATAAGVYTVVLSNSCGNVTSVNSITVALSGTSPTAPIISANATTICAGSSANLSVPNQNGVNYQWKLDGNNIGANTNTLVATNAGIYTIEVSNSCGTVLSSNSISLLVNNPPNEPTITANGATTFCQGQSVDLSIIMQSGVTYQWTLNGNTIGTNTNTLTATQAGLYEITVTNNCGSENASNTIQVSISGVAPSVPLILANGPVSFCNGGSVELSITQQSGVTYQWKLNGSNVGTNTNIYTASQAGNYTIELSNNCGNVLSSNNITVVINGSAPIVPTITANGSTTFCQGQSVDLSIISQTGASYQWQLNGNNIGTNSNTLNATQAGTYTVSVTNACGNVTSINTITVTISGVAPNAPAISANGAIAFCDGESVELSIPTQAGVTYQWQLNGNNVGANSTTFTATQTGIYQVGVSNSCGTILSVNTINVTVNSLPTAPIINALGGSNICAGQSVTIESTGGSAAYLWSNNETTQNITVSSAGNFSLVTIDGNGCESPVSNTITIVLITPPAVPQLVTANAICAGTTAQLEVAALVNVNWFPTAFGGNSLGSGNTFITPILNVTTSYFAESNDNGCTSASRLEVIVNVNQNPVITIDSIVNAGCNGATNGAAYITVNNGLAPYSFNWSNGLQTEDIVNVVVGAYNVTVVDNNLCSSSLGNININSSSSITATAQITDVECAGSLSGSIQVTTTGGTPPFTYDWGNGQTDALAVFLSGGDYYVTITDAANCVSIQGPFFVFEPDSLQLSFTVTDQTSFALGYIDLSVTGGTTPYTYAWSNTETSEDIIDLIAGTYSVIVTDSNNCTVNGNAVVNLVTALMNNQSVSMAIYPNPINDHIIIELPSFKTYHIYLFDINGKLLNSLNSASGRTFFDVHELPASSYLIQVLDTENHSIENLKLIKN